MKFYIDISFGVKVNEKKGCRRQINPKKLINSQKYEQEVVPHPKMSGTKALRLNGIKIIPAIKNIKLKIK